jgi:hypothetical protein
MSSSLFHHYILFGLNELTVSVSDSKKIARNIVPVLIFLSYSQGFADTYTDTFFSDFCLSPFALALFFPRHALRVTRHVFILLVSVVGACDLEF